MTRRIDHSELLLRREIAAAPAPRSRQDQTFELPPALYFGTAALFLGFVTVLSLAFSSHMLVSWGVIALFITMFFAVPTIFTRFSLSEQRPTAIAWSEFMERGVQTATGHTSGAEATVLVLLLPFLIFCFAVAVVIIAALA